MEIAGGIKLTGFAHGGGCGCKIAPAVLQEILKTNTPQLVNDKLLVGNSTNDDAAAYDLGNGTALISTNDFFTPIVDDPYDFGRVAAANSISDVYAMGGKPIVAIAILGWPVEKLPVAAAQQVLEGARAVCNEAGLPLAGGHSIDTPEPVFGLAVNGLCDIKNLKRNNTAKEGDALFLTKPIGVGVLAAAQKRGALSEDHLKILVAQLIQLNRIGEELGKIQGVTAMTDVTGFGLAGHLIEMAEGSGLSAELFYQQIQITEGVKEYLAQRITPDATFRNWNGYSSKIHFDTGVDVMEAFSLLPDPQTNGGLLVAVNAAAQNDVVSLFERNGLAQFIQPVGKMIARQEKVVIVK
ncbi:MAG: selenide, water dikinase [Flavipsychrobacter sp.]|jgi:selenide,water dikinase|nr:selenide, water dikinase [Flavipsychrobacter sp.]